MDELTLPDTLNVATAYVDANIAYGTWISVEAILAPIIGGLGTVFGPLVGAVALHGLGEITKLAAGSVPG